MFVWRFTYKKRNDTVANLFTVNKKNFQEKMVVRELLAGSVIFLVLSKYFHTISEFTIFDRAYILQ